jgi:hypothetical protein
VLLLNQKMDTAWGPFFYPRCSAIYFSPPPPFISDANNKVTWILFQGVTKYIIYELSNSPTTRNCPNF